MTEDQKNECIRELIKVVLFRIQKQSFHGGTMSNFRQQKFKEG